MKQADLNSMFKIYLTTIKPLHIGKVTGDDTAYYFYVNSLE